VAFPSAFYPAFTHAGGLPHYLVHRLQLVAKLAGYEQREEDDRRAGHSLSLVAGW
jgi:hypothetical protein